MAHPYDTDLDRNPANFAALTPLGFIERAASVYPQRTAVIHGQRRFTWAETYARCRRLASALATRGIGEGDTVSAMLSNTPEMYEAHFGVPMTGAVLHAINTRLDAATVAFMLDHCDAKVVLIDREFSATMKAAPLPEELRSRIAAQTRGGLGRELDEVSRRRQSLGEIGGRIVSIRRLWRELVLSTAQQLAPTDLSLAQVAALGVASFENLGVDTYADEARCYSYRRSVHRNEPDYGRQLSAIALI